MKTFKILMFLLTVVLSAAITFMVWCLYVYNTTVIEHGSKGGMFMTHNTIAYAELLERRRSNKEAERELNRAHVAAEQEAIRSNKAREEETKRHDLVQEQIGYAQVAAQNYATAQNAANVASQVAATRYAAYLSAQTASYQAELNYRARMIENYTNYQTKTLATQKQYEASTYASRLQYQSSTYATNKSYQSSVYSTNKTYETSTARNKIQENYNDNMIVLKTYETGVKVGGSILGNALTGILRFG